MLTSDKEIIEAIDNRLRDIFEDNYMYVMDIMDRNNIVISGSFILQCIYGVDWGTDIDFFVPVNGGGAGNFSELEDYFYKHYRNAGVYEDVNGYESVINKILFVREYNTPVKRSKCTVNGIGYDKNKPIFQVIRVDVKPKDMYKYICDSFDLNICKNIYYVNDGIKYLELGSKLDIMKKDTTYVPGHRTIKSFNRCNRYISRGIKIRVNDEDINTIISLFQDRYPGYKKRLTKKFVELFDINEKVDKIIQ